MSSCVTTTRRACARGCLLLDGGGGFGIAGAHASRSLLGGARFPSLTAVARVGGALVVRREWAHARRSSLTLLVSSAGVSVFIVWRGGARARPVALYLVTLATIGFPLAPGCLGVRCGAGVSLAVAWLLWDRRSRLDYKRGVAAPADGMWGGARARELVVLAARWGGASCRDG